MTSSKYQVLAVASAFSLIVIVSLTYSQDILETVDGAASGHVGRDDDPAITVSPEELNFDQVRIDEEEELILTINNEGDADLIVSDILVEGDYFSTDFEDEIIIPSEESMEVSVLFAPEEYGEFEGELTISSNDPDGGELTVSLTGYGVVGVIIEVGFYDTPGTAWDVDVIDDYAYIADDRRGGLRVINVSDPEHPEETGAYDTPGRAFRVTVVDGYAYVADGRSGLCVIDISDPRNPDEVGAYDTPGDAYGVDVEGDYAYVADSRSGLRVIDVSDPEDPDEVGAYDTRYSAIGVAVVFDYAFVANAESGLRVIDVSNPENPDEIGACDTPGFAYGVTVVDDYAYVSDMRGGLRIIDVSEPWNPDEVGNYETPGHPECSVVVGDYAFVADDNGGLRVIDISDPQNPEEVGFYDTLGNAWGVTVVGNYAYVTCGTRGLRILDVSEFIPQVPDIDVRPHNLNFNDVQVTTSEEMTLTISNGGIVDLTVSDIRIEGEGFIVDFDGEFDVEPDGEHGVTVRFEPRIPVHYSSELFITSNDPDEDEVIVGLYGDGVDREIGAFNTPGMAQTVVIVGNLAYVADYRDGLCIIDVSDPRNPEEVGTWETDDEVWEAVVVGEYAYLANYRDGVRVVDIIPPNNPRGVGRLNTPERVYGITVDGDYAYAADGPGGFIVIDISDPRNPRTVGTCDTPGEAWDIEITGNLACVGDRGGGLHVIDISNPNNPRELGYCDPRGRFQKVIVEGDYAFAAAWESGLYVIDISDPENPEEVGHFNTSGDAFGLTKVGDYVFIADGQHGLKVIDVSDFENMQRVWCYDTQGGTSALDVTVAGEYAYVAYQRHGLVIFDVSEFVSPVPGIATTPVAQPFEGAVNLEFPDAFVDDDTSSIRITIRNIGRSDLLIHGVQISNDEDFWSNLEPEIDIEPNDSLEFDIFFEPDNPGDCEGQIHIFTDAENIGEGDEMGHVWFDMFGVGVLPPIITTQPDDREGISVAMGVEDDPVRRNVIIGNDAGEHGVDLRFFISTVEEEEEEDERNRRSLRGVHGIDKSNNPPLIPPYCRRGGKRIRCTTSGPRRDDAGDILAQYEVPYPATKGLAWDGELMWGVVFFNDRLFAIDPSDGEVVHDFPIHNHPSGMTRVGEYFWIGYGNRDIVMIYNRDGEVVDQFSIELSNNNGFAWDHDSHVYIKGFTRQNIHVVDVDNYDEIANVDLLEAVDYENYYVTCLEWVPAHGDGHLWATTGEWVDDERGEFFAYRFSIDEDWNAEVVGRFEFEQPGYRHTGIAHDGENLWHGGQSDGRVWDVYDDGIDEAATFWLDVHPRRGTVAPGEEFEIDLIFNAERLDEDTDYYCDLLIESNDPETPVVTIPVHLNTGGAPEPRELVVPLRRDWNIVSINIVPPGEFWECDEGPDIPLMFEQLRVDDDHHHVIIVKDEDGRFFLPDAGYNGIHHWNFTEGYMVEVDEDVEVAWSGIPIPADADISLDEGWNIIGYFPTYELDAGAPDFHVISPIIEDVIIAKDVLGRFMTPHWNYSDMLPWREGEGYKIKVYEDVVLNYPEQGEEFAVNRGGSTAGLDLRAVRAKTSQNMSVLVTSVTGVDITSEDRIGAFTVEGNLAGSGTFDKGGRCGLAVWGDDLGTDVVKGLKPGEAFELGLLRANQETEVKLHPVLFHVGRELVYEDDNIIVLDVTVSTDIPEEFNLFDIYPNPFNDMTSVRFNLAMPGHVTVDVYDISGRLVTRLVDGMYKAGNHSTVWRGSALSAGVYIVRLESDGFSDNVKVLLLK